ncbi:hypothetical protein BGZ76_001679 [Entomortierella beljakovae]|nr:hypothetical protein BGZ76_001679 [Entomortierella beljakovae]
MRDIESSQSMKDLTGFVTCLEYSPRGDQLASGGEDKIIEYGLSQKATINLPCITTVNLSTACSIHMKDIESLQEVMINQSANGKSIRMTIDNMKECCIGFSSHG